MLHNMQLCQEKASVFEDSLGLTGFTCLIYKSNCIDGIFKGLNCQGLTVKLMTMFSFSFLEFIVSIQQMHSYVERIWYHNSIDLCLEW